MSNSIEGVKFIAEVSANHLGSLERALELVTRAAKAGATAVKFQTYTADTMTLDLPTFSVTEGHELWGGRTLYSLYEEAHTPWEWHEELFALARELGVLPFSSPFDLTAVNFLESLNAPMYKIASLETGDHALIRAVAETGKPVIISTGATELEEIEEDLVNQVQNLEKIVQNQQQLVNNESQILTKHHYLLNKFNNKSEAYRFKLEIFLQYKKMSILFINLEDKGYQIVKKQTGETGI